jgi:ribonuclease-3
VSGPDANSEPGPVEEPSASEEGARLERIERIVGHRFVRRELLEEALRHGSYIHDHPELESNERLEFLGDAVLGLIVADSLFRAKPDWREGELTRALHAVVEGRSLAATARTLAIGPALRLGRTERRSGGAEKASILANAMEALVGALFLDGGLPAAARFVERVFAEALSADAPAVGRDPKTELQERLMAREGEFPRYRLVSDSEIEGDEARFEVEVVLRDVPLARGIGRTKRAAERQAAEAALECSANDDD